MPSQPNYPGAYVQENASGVRTITGVPTSITAFIGRALSGPVEEPILIHSFGDFERVFGGLWSESYLGFAVRDFFLNGGSTALVVRLYHSDSVKPEKATVSANGLPLEASDPGEWGNSLRVRVDTQVIKEVAAEMGIQMADLFNLTVQDTKTGATEQFSNLTVIDSSRRVDRVLKKESLLVRLKGNPPGNTPPSHGDPAEGKSVFEDDNASSRVGDPEKASDGNALEEKDFTGPNTQSEKKGLYAVKKADIFNILCIPPYALEDVDSTLIGEAAQFCEDQRAFLLVDPPSDWRNTDMAKSKVGAIGTTSKNAALFFPRLKQPNPFQGNQLREFVPCGAVAGIFARTDVQRGVWKAPAGQEATLIGVPELGLRLTDIENQELNPIAVNCLRAFPPATGPVVWGSRTLQGADRLASDWKYIPVRRLALFLEDSLYSGTQWVIVEPNDEPLWAQIRQHVGVFMQDLFRQGAFRGRTQRDAYFVKCDKETTTQNDINRGIVNILVGFAPLKPAEFVIITIQQRAGQIVPPKEGHMAQPAVNAQPFDPYKTFKFRVKWDGRYAAGIAKVQGLKRTTEVVEHREGGDPSTGRKSPDRTKHEAIVLERGVTHDQEFQSWAKKAWNYDGGLGAEASPKNFRKDIIIGMYNEAGQLVIAYKVYRCWVSEFQAQPDLDANANAIAIQHMKLENEGWVRDVAVEEPTEPSSV
jgi:uncharacterized protein